MTVPTLGRAARRVVCFIGECSFSSEGIAHGVLPIAGAYPSRQMGF